MVNHKDGNKHNNIVTNLEWVTPRENLLHRSRVLGHEIGDKHHAAKLRAHMIPRIRKLLAAGESPNSIGKEFGVTGRTITYVAKRITWFHVP